MGRRHDQRTPDPPGSVRAVLAAVLDRHRGALLRAVVATGGLAVLLLVVGDSVFAAVIGVVLLAGIAWFGVWMAPVGLGRSILPRWLRRSPPTRRTRYGPSAGGPEAEHRPDSAPAPGLRSEAVDVG